MRILHVIPSIAPCYGGPSQQAIELCCHLEKNNVHVDLLTTNADGQSILPVVTGKWIRYKGVNCLFFNRDFSEAFKYSSALSGWIKSNVANYDVVHIHAVFSHSSIVAARACLRAKVPYVIRPLGTIDPWSLSQKSFRKKLFLALGVKHLLKKASVLQFSTELEKEHTSAHLALSNGVVIPNGIACSEYRNGDLTERPGKLPSRIIENQFILFLGRLDEKKNIAALIAAFSELNKNPVHETLNLVIAGTGDHGYESMLRQNALQTGLNTIHFTGWVDGDMKRWLLTQARLFVLPSKNENYAIAVAESLACGTPVVVTRGVYLFPDIEDAACGWVCNSVEGLGKTLLHALGSSELESRGKNGQRLIAEKFDWSEVIHQLSKVYQQLMKGN